MRDAVLRELQAAIQVLEDTLNSELKGAVFRITHADASEQPPDPGEPFQVGRVSKSSSTDDAGTSPPRRWDHRRRFTAAADGKESLAQILKSSLLPAASSAEETAENSSVTSPVGDDDRHQEELALAPMGRTESGDRGKRTLHARIEERLNEVHQHQEPGDDDEDMEEMGSVVSTPSCSSTNWRVDALDLGDRLAATSAAKKGSASVESIVNLVASERERWEAERQGLEARIEELKEQLITVSSPPDTEHEALKKKLHSLRQAVKERSRFGAWVCERHMQESDDEDEAENPRNADKEELRLQMQELERELRNARQAAAKGRRHNGGAASGSR